MPSTFSARLRLELPASGEQDGQWGVTLNRVLGTLIETAIAGIANVEITAANQALTASQGVADEARNAVLRITNVHGAAANLYAPPVSKLYLVKNDSAYNVTLYNSTSLGNTTAAGDGVTVAPGRLVPVVTDGEDFFVLEIAAVAAAIITGQLAITQGGTGASTAESARTALGTNNVPMVTTSGPTAISTAHRGQCVSVDDDFTVNSGVLSPGELVVVYNRSGATVDLVGSGVTFYWINGVTGNRQLLQKGQATLHCVGTNTFVVAGQGVA